MKCYNWNVLWKGQEDVCYFKRIILDRLAMKKSVVTKTILFSFLFY